MSALDIGAFFDIRHPQLVQEILEYYDFVCGTDNFEHTKPIIHISGSNIILPGEQPINKYDGLEKIKCFLNKERPRTRITRLAPSEVAELFLCKDVDNPVILWMNTFMPAVKIWSLSMPASMRPLAHPTLFVWRHKMCIVRAGIVISDYSHLQYTDSQSTWQQISQMYYENHKKEKYCAMEWISTHSRGIQDVIPVTTLYSTFNATSKLRHDSKEPFIYPARALLNKYKIHPLKDKRPGKHKANIKVHIDELLHQSALTWLVRTRRYPLEREWISVPCIEALIWDLVHSEYISLTQYMKDAIWRRKNIDTFKDYHSRYILGRRCQLLTRFEKTTPACVTQLAEEPRPTNNVRLLLSTIVKGTAEKVHASWDEIVDIEDLLKDKPQWDVEKRKKELLANLKLKAYSVKTCTTMRVDGRCPYDDTKTCMKKSDYIYEFNYDITPAHIWGNAPVNQ